MCNTSQTAKIGNPRKFDPAKVKAYTVISMMTGAGRSNCAITKLSALLGTCGLLATGMEPNWYSARTFWLKNIDLPEEHPFKGLDGYNVPSLKGNRPPQESDLVKQLLLDIAQYGLNYAYEEWTSGRMRNPDPKWKFTKTTNPKKVLIVGAGMSGLCAGYELSQAGHEVEILETKDLVGGRVKTVREPFTRGLYAEGKQ